jgi:TetR/AcrR family transcriptional regulator, copper-responsive repressor
MARTGRPREFDADAAIQQAMLVFWEHGYEATSLAELKAAMGGISTASFYAAFGSKEDLFRTVLTRYLDTHGRVMAALRDESLTPREAIERALRQSAAMQTGPGHPPGCLIVLATTMTSKENTHLQALLAKERAGNRAALRTMVDRAVTSGELPAETPADALASMYDGFLVGLATQARDGVPFQTLDASVTEIMRVWDQYAARKCVGRTTKDRVRRRY